MGEDVDIIVPIRADVIVDRHYPVTASPDISITALVLAPTGYGIAIDTTPLGSDRVKANELVHNFQMIAGNVHPQTSVRAILHEEASTVIVDVERTNTDILAGKDGIRFG